MASNDSFNRVRGVVGQDATGRLVMWDEMRTSSNYSVVSFTEGHTIRLS